MITAIVASTPVVMSRSLLLARDLPTGRWTESRCRAAAWLLRRRPERGRGDVSGASFADDLRVASEEDRTELGGRCTRRAGGPETTNGPIGFLWREKILIRPYVWRI